MSLGGVIVMNFVPGTGNTTTFSIVPTPDSGTQSNVGLDFFEVVICLFQIEYKLSGDRALPLPIDLKAPTIMLRPYGGNEITNPIQGTVSRNL